MRAVCGLCVESNGNVGARGSCGPAGPLVPQNQANQNSEGLIRYTAPASEGLPPCEANKHAPADSELDPLKWLKDGGYSEVKPKWTLKDAFDSLGREPYLFTVGMYQGQGPSGWMKGTAMTASVPSKCLVFQEGDTVEDVNEALCTGVPAKQYTRYQHVQHGNCLLINDPHGVRPRNHD